MKRKTACFVGLMVLLSVIFGVLSIDPVREFLDDDLATDSQDISANLADDLALMWETSQMRESRADQSLRRHASTERAVEAASRAFNTVNLVGMPKGEVVEKLGDPKTSSNSIYNFPFYPAARGTLVYRFDTGAGGWQFNIYFDWSGKVRKVQRLGIE